MQQNTLRRTAGAVSRQPRFVQCPHNPLLSLLGKDT